MGEADARVRLAISFSFSNKSVVKKVPSSPNSSDSGCSTTSQDRWLFLKERGAHELRVDPAPRLNVAALARAPLSARPRRSVSAG
jgi:hypothetical protein